MESSGAARSLRRGRVLKRYVNSERRSVRRRTHFGRPSLARASCSLPRVNPSGSALPQLKVPEGGVDWPYELLPAQLMVPSVRMAHTKLDPTETSRKVVPAGWFAEQVRVWSAAIAHQP